MSGDAQDDVFDEFIAEIIARWDKLRESGDASRADTYVREWLFEYIPEKLAESISGAAPESIALDHAKAMFDVLSELDRRGRIVESFSVLTWIGEKYARHSKSGVAWSVITAVAEYCESRAHIDEKHSEGAVRSLRALIGAAGRPMDIHVERALAGAMEHLYHAISYWSRDRYEQAAELTGLLSEMIRRWQDSNDPTLRSRAAIALLNQALFALHVGREDDARHDFAEIVDRFGEDPLGMGVDVDRCVCIARHAPAILDQTMIPGIESNLELRSQQEYWSAQRQHSNYNQNHWQQLVEAARDKHKNSVGRLRSALCTGEPITLLLRSFALTEHSGNLLPGSSLIWDDTREPSGHFYRSIHLNKSDKIMTELSRRTTLVAAASITAGELELRSDVGEFVPDIKLYLPNDDWFEIVCHLIAAASQIIVRAAKMNNGLAMELAALAAAQRMDDTVVIIEERDDFPWNSLLHWNEGEILTKGHPLLANFPHVMSGADLSSRSIEDCPELVRLLAQLRAVSDKPLEERLAKTTASLEAATIPEVHF